MKLGLLASGNLGFSVLKELVRNNKLEFVMTDNKSDEIIAFCKENNLPVFIGNPRNGKCDKFIEDKGIDVLISVNYLFIIEKKLLNHPTLIAFNIHGSLLPKYRGRTPHVWAIINNEIETGITVHKIDEGCDTGAIIDQVKVPIEFNDTGADILNKFNKLYSPLIHSVLNTIKEKKVVIRNQDNSKATYFGKRTPEDGRINWEWQKERIRNWVRAHAFPYPGAFTFLDDKKIIIDEVQYNDFGFKDEMPNGLILSLSPLLIKTSNGVIEVTKRRESNADLFVNSVLK